MVVTFKEENLMTFKHLFLKDYVDGGMDTYAVYRQEDVYDHIDYIIRQVNDGQHSPFLYPPCPRKPHEGMILLFALNVLLSQFVSVI